MTTPRDLLFVALDAPPDRAPAQGALSLALAGAELVDLREAGAVGLDGDRLVPGFRPAVADRLMDEAASSLDQQPPYESAEDWLWRRGRGLAAAYLAALEAEGQLTRQGGGRWKRFRAGELKPADSPAHRAATDRWAAGEPVLTALGTSLGIGGERPADPPELSDDAVATVLAAVDTAVRELEFERQRRALDEEAFSNVWRGYDGW
ncbi:GPP34 family phosphoprotein [Streptomyces angustmyceticus]|uniref:GPP34 family phosphoprotein n=1 Tax=Streptomyces angustmyceticus TaxID=285578 RepID=UPI003D9432EE